MDPQITYCFAWRGIEIMVVYTQRKWNAIDHLDIRSMKPEGERLSITTVGYRSHFHPLGTVEAHGGDVVALVSAWLDEDAAIPDWLTKVAASKQGRLF